MKQDSVFSFPHLLYLSFLFSLLQEENLPLTHYSYAIKDWVIEKNKFISKVPHSESSEWHESLYWRMGPTKSIYKGALFLSSTVHSPCAVRFVLPLLPWVKSSAHPIPAMVTFRSQESTSNFQFHTQSQFNNYFVQSTVLISTLWISFKVEIPPTPHQGRSFQSTLAVGVWHESSY